MPHSNIPRRQVAIVTGSSSGIGLATSIALAKEGSRIYATMRDLDNATILREVIRLFVFGSPYPL